MRDRTIDILKGITILLVVWGHSIQYANNGNIDFFTNPIFVFIYTFHMPLFMFVSGWVFFYNFDLRSAEMLVRARTRSTLVPMISWTVVFTTIDGIMQYGVKFGYSLYHLSVSKVYDSFWFLTVLLIIGIFAILVLKLSERLAPFIIAIVFIALQLAPDVYYLYFIKFMFPYFFLGFYGCKYRYLLSRHKKIIGLGCSVFFVVVLAIWKTDYYVYTTGMSLWVPNPLKQLQNNIVRYVAGLVGIGSVFYCVSLLQKNPILDRTLSGLARIGRNSLTIYVLSGVIFSNVVSRIPYPTFLSENFWLYTFGTALAVSGVVAIVCISVSVLLAKSSMSSQLLLGLRRDISETPRPNI
jgi:fucose 4-O-acetylase-like acetyltransferase